MQRRLIIAAVAVLAATGVAQAQTLYPMLPSLSGSEAIQLAFAPTNVLGPFYTTPDQLATYIGSAGVNVPGVAGSIQIGDGSGHFGTPIVPAANMSNWLALGTSAGLRAALIDETGTGPAVFGTGPTITGAFMSGLTLTDLAGIGTRCVHVNASGAPSAASADCGAGGGGTPGGSPGQLQYQIDASTFGGATVGTGLDMTSGALTLSSVTVDKTASNQAIVAGDANKTVLVGTHAYTIAQAGTTGFPAKWSVCALNTSSGDATLTATTSTFPGATSGSVLTLHPGTFACPTSDGTNYPTYFGTRDGGDLNAATVTNAKLAVMPTQTLKGNATGGSAVPTDITLGTNLSFSGNVLNAAGGATGCTTSGASILIGNGSGGCSNVTVSTGLNLTGTTLTATAVSGTKQNVMFSSGTTTIAANNYIGTITANATWGSSQPFYANGAGTMSNVTCLVNGGPGGGNSFTVDAYQGIGGSFTPTDVSASLQASMSGTTPTSTLVHSTPVSLSAGDLFAFKIVVTGGSVTGDVIRCSALWQPS